MVSVISGNPLSQNRFKSERRESIMDDKRLRFVEGKQKEFLEEVIREEFGSVKKFVEFIGFSRSGVFVWRTERNLLPKGIFQRICTRFPKYRAFESFILEELSAEWGACKGRKGSALRMKHIQNSIKDAMLSGDTSTLKECIKLIRKQGLNDNLVNAPHLGRQRKKPLLLLDTSKVTFSRNDLGKGITLPNMLSVDLCYLIGAHIGDGSMNIYSRSTARDYYYRCCGHQINDLPWYDSVLIPLIKKLFNLKLKAKNCSDGTYSISFRSKAVVNFYNKCCELPFGKKSEIISIPKVVLDSGIGHMLACISGIFDTDFYLGFKNKNNTVHSYPFIELNVKSKPLVETISNILNKIGISNSITSSKRFDKRFGKTIEMHSVTTRGRKNINRWFELIGSRNPNYLSKYFIWKKFGFCPPNLNYNQRKEILNGNRNPLDFYKNSSGNGETRTHDLPVSEWNLSAGCATTAPHSLSK